MKNYLILLLIFILGCSANTHYPPTVFKKEYKTLSLPSWLLKIPDGKFAIGVSQKNYNKKSELIEAKEFATVNFNRNKHSFIVNNVAKVINEQFSNEQKFKVNVSSSIKNLKSISDSLSLVDSTYVGEYFLALFHYGKFTGDLNKEKKIQLSIPNWYIPKKIQVKDNKIIATVKYSSAYLTTAINKAMENARFMIASYKTQHVQSISTTTYNSTEKSYSLESKMVLGNLKTTNLFILKKKSDNALTSYEVYIRMKAEQ